MPGNCGDLHSEKEQVAAHVKQGCGAVIVRPSVDYWTMARWACDALFGALQERRVPVYCREGLVSLDQVGEIARRYPDATILLAHLRTMNEAGYYRIAREHPNVFVDTVGSSAARGLVERGVAAIGADKIVWGSDAYCYGLPQQIGKVLGAKISDEDKVKILSGNAQRILARRAR